ncbi:hypothetical protein COE47_35065, partial [Bacillus thuringiensis]
ALACCVAGCEVVVTVLTHEDLSSAAPLRRDVGRALPRVAQRAWSFLVSFELHREAGRAIARHEGGVDAARAGLDLDHASGHGRAERVHLQA